MTLLLPSPSESHPAQTRLPENATIAQAAPPATRTAAVLIPAWPLVVARDHLDRTAADEARAGAATAAAPPRPLIVMARHRVLHADDLALAQGVAIGMRRRSAQAACPEAIVVDSDRERESALFELVAAAVDSVAAGVDVLRPGVLLMSARGPARHQGGEEALAERIVDAVADATGWDCAVGIADGPFAALLAARTGRIVRPGRSGDYLAPHALDALREAPVGPGWGHRDRPAAISEKSGRLDLAEVIDLLARLGIATLGDFVALPRTSVAARFGADVAQLHLLAGGGEPTPPAAHHPTQPIEVIRALETPLVRADQAAFISRPMAEELHSMLVARGLICTRLRISARTASGEELERTWRHDGALAPADVVDRIRWQCDGWITSARLRRSGARDVGEIVRIGLHPLQLMPAGEGAPALWGSAGEAAQRAGRAFARAQGLAGEDAVLVPAEAGGRLLRDQVHLVPWRSEKPDPKPGPWPGALPRPLPAVVFAEPPPVQLRAADGAAVVVTARGLLSAPPAVLRLPPTVDPADDARSATTSGRVSAGSGAPVAAAPADSVPSPTVDLGPHGLEPDRDYPVVAFGRPSILDERWWSPNGERAARLHLVLESGHALLVLCRAGQWHAEGLYD